MKEYLVSVRLMTFNHVQYIANAIDSVLMQKTKFYIELVIGDDFSTDGTSEIIRRYRSTSNVDVKVLERKIGDQYWKNRKEKGRLYNFINIINNCNGKYIAFLDGDDYWTDPYKLQKQVDFLEQNSEYGMSHSDCDFLYQNTGRIEYRVNKKMTQNDKIKYHEVFENILLNNFRIRTASVLIRSELLQKIRTYEDYDKIISLFPMGDTPIWLELSRISKIHYIDKSMVVYRVLESSACRISDPFQNQLFQLRALELRLYYIDKYYVTNKTKRIIRYKFIRKISRLYLSGFKFEMVIPSHMYKNTLFVLIMFFIKINFIGKLYRYLFRIK